MQPVLQAPLHREDAGAVDVADVALAARALRSQVIHFYQEIFVIVHLESAKREPVRTPVRQILITSLNCLMGTLYLAIL